jgi:hypothetical protein
MTLRPHPSLLLPLAIDVKAYTYDGFPDAGRCTPGPVRHRRGINFDNGPGAGSFSGMLEGKCQGDL